MTGPLQKAHRLMNEADGLHQPWYYQEADPGAVGAKVCWLKPIPDITTPTSWQLYQRNAANTAWVLIFDTDTIGGAPTSHATSHAEGGDDEVTLTQAQITGLTAALASKLSSPIAQSDVTGLVAALAALQPLDAELTALAGLNSTAGLVEQTGAAAFTKRAIGVAAGTSIPTKSDLDTALAAKADTSYVDAAVAGLSWKQAVRAATTVAGTLASSFEDGDVIDGVTLATNDRILIKNQAAPAENGIYKVNASGAPTRTTDADSAAEVLQASVYVQEGTTLADTQWTCTTNAPITLNTTGLVFAQLSSGGGVTGSGTTGTIPKFASGTSLGDSALVEATNDITSSKSLILPASVTGRAPLQLPHGTAPSSPVNGEVWTTTAGIYVRINGVTIGPLGAGGGGNPWTNVLTLDGSTFAGFTGVVGTWAAGSGVISQTNSGVSGHAKYNTQMPLARAFIKAKVKIVTGASGTVSRVGIIVGYNGTLTQPTIVYIEGSTTVGTKVQADRAGVAVLATETTAPAYGTFHDLWLDIAGASIAVYLNGTLMFTLMNPADTAEVRDHRYFGLYSNSASVEFDDIEVWRQLRPGE